MVSARGSTPAVDVRLLGEVSMWVEGVPVPTGGPQQRSVLAVLALGRGRATPIGELIDRLWVDDPPRTATKTIQVYVSRLRHALDRHGGRLRTTAAGYALALDESEVDVGRFEREVRLARSARSNGEDHEVVTRLAAALRSWSGPALADLVETPFARQEAARLEELRGQVAEELLEARLRTDGPRQVAPDLRRWTAEHPERERLWALLMLALYLDGRQTDALDTYLQAHRYLADEHGIEPGPGLRDLQHRILVQDPTLLSGHASIAQPAADRAAVDTFEPLIGRSALLASLIDRVSRQRMVTLVGPGGTGKTSLALAVVEALRVEREAVFVDASSLTDGVGLGALIATALGIVDLEPTLPAVAGRLGASRRLIALDNLEQARDIGAAIGALLSSARNLRILATSRAPTGAPGEVEVFVPPLGLPDDDAPEQVERAPATALFLERARAIGRLEPTLDRRIAGEVARLCARLDGLPLAIELAAARTRILSPSEILARLDDHGGRVLRRADGPERHRSLEAVLDWSLSLLSPDERRLLAGCAICPGTFDLDLIAAIATIDDPEAALDRLVAYGLVAAEDAPAGIARFRVLETVRIVLRDRLGPTADAARRRHAQVVARRVAAQDARLESRGSRQARTRLELDLDDLDAAVEWSIDHDPGSAVDLVCGSLTHRVLSGMTHRTIATLETLRSKVSPRSRHRARLAAALTRLGGVAGREAATREFAEEAVALGRRLAMPEVEIEGLYALIVPAPDPELASGGVDRRLVDRFRSLPLAGPRERAIATEIEVVIAGEEGGDAAAATVLRDALVRARGDGALRRVAYLADGLATRLLAMDQASDALPVAVEAVEAAREIGDIRLEMFGLDTLATASAWAGDDVGARRAMARALVIGVALGTPHSVATSLRGAAMVAACGGRLLDAAWISGAALAAFEPVRLPGFDEEGEVPARHWHEARAGIGARRWSDTVRRGRGAGVDAGIERARRSLSGDHIWSDDGITLRMGDLLPPDIELLTLVGEGVSDDDIALALGRSPRRIVAHVANLRAGLGLADRPAMIERARDLGLVPPAHRGPSPARRSAAHAPGWG